MLLQLGEGNFGELKIMPAKKPAALACLYIHLYKYPLHIVAALYFVKWLLHTQ